MGRSTKLFKKRIFTGNQYKKAVHVSQTYSSRPNLEASSPSLQSEKKAHCASFTKLNSGINEEFLHINKPSTYLVLDIDILCNQLKSFVVCKNCGVGNVTLKEDLDKRMGCASQLLFLCDNCGVNQGFMSSDKTNTGQYDINMRLVYALRSVGKGHDDAKMICTLLDIPGPPTRFMKYNRIIATTIKKVAEKSMIEAVQEVVDKTENSDLTVAIDGSWQKRGHTSLNGVVTATSIETGKVLDVHALSKYCQGCQLAKEHLKEKHEYYCELNYTGNSGGMEIEGARAIFSRSMMTRGVRYLTYLGDGDSKGYAGVCEDEPYGPDVEIEKAECIGHIQKRMGSRLRKLCKTVKKGEKLSDGKPLRGKGRLTDSEINNLQVYYGKGIRENCQDVGQMKKAIWAIYYHKMSTDEKPIHSLCPKGEDSWCGYNRALITKENYTHKHSLPMSVLEKIRPIFEDLSNETLLRRCCLGKTQNPNESFNGLIWKRIPKTVFVGIVTLNIGVYDAELSFNKGA